MTKFVAQSSWQINSPLYLVNTIRQKCPENGTGLKAGGTFFPTAEIPGSDRCFERRRILASEVTDQKQGDSLLRTIARNHNL